MNWQNTFFDIKSQFKTNGRNRRKKMSCFSSRNNIVLSPIQFQFFYITLIQIPNIFVLMDAEVKNTRTTFLN